VAALARGGEDGLMGRLAAPTAPAPRDDDYAHFQRKVLVLTGVDLTAYKAEQMRRRLGNLMARVGARGFVDYAAMLARDPERLREFADFFTINVSEFYRDPKRWDELRGLLHGLLRDRPVLKIWSAGCSIGAEPYSVAMLLADLSPLTRHTIIATDIDRAVLERARRGDRYTAADVRHVPPGLARRFLTARADGTHAVREDLRQRVIFKPHDLLSSPYERECDLILCRNVVIYFTDEAKRAIYRRFRESLTPRGLLFVGATEVIMHGREIGLEGVMTSFYTRAAGAPDAPRSATASPRSTLLAREEPALDPRWDVTSQRPG
jgi:chemotaxis protein methyltransferase CheR